jgi:ABC-2 type transport system permease protein
MRNQTVNGFQKLVGMRAFIELVRRSFRRQISYRAATLAGLVTNLFFGALRAAVMIALYGEEEVVAGVSLQGAVTYTGISQAIIGFLSFFGWYELMNTVYSGSIGSDLLKPMGFFDYWLAQDIGRAVAQFLLRTIPIMIGYAVLFDISYPNNFLQCLGVFTSLVFALLVSFSYRFLLNLASFWIPNVMGITRFGFVLLWFFSGFLMPLRFFPDWFTKICYLTPFPYMLNIVVDIYLGLIVEVEIIYALIAQCLWAMLLVLIGKLILRAGIRRLVILGG